MRRLYLHIGHGKTGSSYLQSSFANSIPEMAAQGIDYPLPPSKGASAAGDWQISSGNGSMLINMPADEIPVSGDTVFFSSEGLFHLLLADPENIMRLTEFCTHQAFDRVDILLFLRDPIPHAESSYQQMIKRGGATYGVDVAFHTYNTPTLAQFMLTLKIGELPITWHIHNYDRNRAGLIPVAERFLGLSEGSLVKGDGKVVNRSMTASEITLLRAVNGYDPDLTVELADALCNELPDIPAEPVFPSVAVQQAMLTKQGDAIAAVNARLPDSERYATDLRLETPVDAQVGFSERQIEIIAKVVGTKSVVQSSQIAALRSRQMLQRAKAHLSQGRAQKARDVLNRVTVKLATVIDDAEKARLQDQVDQLSERLGRAGPEG